nr:thiamine pyrophosphate-dependent enzyme [Bacteriovorax sp. HI3]
MTTEILNGNELIIQGALEAGFHLYTGYPGSPLADYFNILYERKNEFKEKGIRVVIANSEANAAAMASGAKQAHKNALVAMKSMGLHVASDALSVGNFANPGKGGVVVVVGDDPWSISTSSPADSRYLFKHLHIPFLDPSTPQELKDWMKIALEISLETSVYQGVLLTTFLAEGGGRVEIGAEKKIDKELIELNPAEFDLAKNVMVPPNSFRADISMIKDRFPKVFDVLKAKKLDQVFGNTASKVGFITSGAVFEILKQVLDDNDALERFSLYKVGAPYPLIDDLLVPYLKTLETIIVVEEKRGFLETELRELMSRHGITAKIYGKRFDDVEGFPIYGGLNYDLVLDKITTIFNKLSLGACHPSKPGVTLSEVMPRRLPTFCPGCPHRETLSLLKDLRGHLKKQNINLISHGDVGCYSLSFLEPFKEMHNLSAMGQGGALGAGVDLFTTNPSVVLMGDSTFFHSGITDISNSVQMSHDITYILLDNDNTAMTGHQMTPRTGESVEGFKRPAQDMLKMVQALGVNEAIEVNPSDRYFYQNLLRETVMKKGTKVIISNKECGLTFHGRKKATERKLFNNNETLDVQRFYQINTDACEDCRACVEMTGCPGLSQTFDAYGSKVTIDPQICVSDSYCTKIKACPSFELVEVSNYHPTKYRTREQKKLASVNLPLPNQKKTLESIAAGVDYRAVVTGVGGSGVTTISRVLAEAAKAMGGRSDVDFKFVDQKGLAQRNGNVTSHLALYKKGKSHAQVTPMGGADVLLSPDLLDGSHHLGFLSETGMAILDKKFQIPLSLLLDRGVEKNPVNEITLANKLQGLLKERITLLPMKEVSENHLGKSVYASALILGAAFQMGLIPFSLNDLEEAFARTMKKAELENNLTAFTLGRRLALGEDLRIEKQEAPVIDLLFASLRESSIFNGSALVQKAKEALVELKTIAEGFGVKEEHLARYIHDLLIFDRGLKLDTFLAEAKKLPSLYKDQEMFAMALRTLAKTYFIKDEVFIAHMMVSPMRRLEDEKNYRDLGTSYKKVFINRPSFDLGDKKVEFDFSPRPWMLKTMRHMRFLRASLPAWHKEERRIASEVRSRILGKPLDFKELRALENIKGYRQVRYDMARHL